MEYCVRKLIPRTPKFVIKNIINYFIGSYLLDEIDEGQIEVIENYAQCTNIDLNIKVINDNLEKQNIPLNILYGFIGCIRIYLPGCAINGKLLLEINDLEISLGPAARFTNPDPDIVFGTMVDSMINMQRSFHEEELSNLIFEEKQKGKNFNALISKWISKLCLTLHNTKISFESRPLTQINRCCRFLCEIEKLEFATRDIDNSRLGSSPLSGILLTNNIEMTGLTLRWEVACSKTDTSIIMTSVTGPANDILYSCQLLSVLNPVQVNYTLLMNNTEPEFEININLDTVQILLSPLPLHWMQVLLSQVVIGDYDPSISKNVKMTESQFESFFSNEDRPQSSFRSQTNDSSIYYDVESSIDGISVNCTSYDDVSLDNSDEDEPFCEFQKDNATCASLSSNLTMFDEDGKVNTNFKASISTKNLCIKLLLRNPSNDTDNWDNPDDFLGRIPDHRNWDYTSKTFFSLLKTSHKSVDSYAKLKEFHLASGDIDYFSAFIQNMSCSIINKKFTNKFHQSLSLSTEVVEFSETVFDHSKNPETMEVLSMSSTPSASESKAIDVKAEYNYLKKEMSLDINLGTCYLGIDISMQDRIRPLVQNNIIEYSVSDKTNSYELNKSKDTNISVGCIGVVNVKSLCLVIYVPLVNLNEEILPKHHWQYRMLNPEKIRFTMLNSRWFCRVPPSNSEYDKDNNHQTVLDLYTSSIVVSLFTADSDDIEIINILNNLDDAPTVTVKIKSKLEQHIDNIQAKDSLRSQDESILSNYYSKIAKKNGFKPYSTKESSKSNSSSKVIHTPENGEKIKQYMRKSTSSSYFDIEVVASTILMAVNDKSVLKVLYDRLMFDLALWEPCFDKRSNDVIINYKSRDISETDDEANTDTSVDEDTSTQTKSKNKFQLKKFTCKIQSDSCRCYLPSSIDKSMETVIELKEVVVFTDSDIIQGLVEAQSICIIEITNIKIFHSDNKVVDSDHHKIRNADHQLNDTYSCVLDHTPTQITKDTTDKMVVVVMESKLLKSKKINRSIYRAKQMASTMITTSLNELCLRVNYINENAVGFEWMLSMMDLFSFNNPVIPGYTIPDSNMKMYLHLNNCAVDLCFSRLTMSAFAILNKVDIEVSLNSTESYCLSSEIAFNGSQIFIRSSDSETAPFYFKWNNDKWMMLSLFDEGFVYVAELGSLDIKFTKIGSTNYADMLPTCHLEITNSETSMHMCADSLSLVISCLTKVMSSRSDMDHELSSVTNNSYNESGRDVVRRVVSAPSLNEKQTNQFNSMITDAMRDNKLLMKNNKPNREEYCDDFLLVEDIFSNIHDSVVNLEKNSSQKLSVVPDHYKSISSEDKFDKMKIPIFKDPIGYPNVENALVIHNFSLSFYLYAGSDLDEMSESKKPSTPFFKTNPKQPMSVPIKFQRFSSDNKPKVTIDTKDFEAYFGDGGSKPVVTRGGPNRKLRNAYELKFSKINFRYALFTNPNWENSPCHQVSRRLVFIVKAVEMMSHNESSSINKLMFCDTNAVSWYDPKSPMVSMKMIFTLSEPNHDVVNESCDIKISIQPIHLNIDQEIILFTEKFYKDLCTNDSINNRNLDPKPLRSHSASTLSESPHQEVDSILIPPKIGVNKELSLGRGGGIDSISGSSPLSRTSTIRMPAFDEMRSKKESGEKQPSIDSSSRSLSTLFIRHFSIYPDVYVRLDYTGTRLDLTQGAIKGLFYILMQLNNVILVIKNKQYVEGVTGLDVLFTMLLKDITEEFYSQMTSIFSKVGPISEVTDILSGIYDFFTLPYLHYHYEGGIFEGIKLGTRSITTTSLWAALTLLSKGLKTFQKMAETTYDLVSPADIGHVDESYHAARDIREGMTNAAQGVRRRFRDTASDFQHAIVRSDRAMVGRIGDVIRQVPPALASPIVATCEATTQLIDGLRYQMKPEMKVEDEKKWKQ